MSECVHQDIWQVSCLPTGSCEAGTCAKSLHTAGEVYPVRTWLSSWNCTIHTYTQCCSSLASSSVHQAARCWGISTSWKDNLDFFLQPCTDLLDLATTVCVGSVMRGVPACMQAAGRADEAV